MQTHSTPKTRHLRIRRASTSYRPGMSVPQELHVQLGRKTLNLHFTVPTGDIEPTDDEIAAARDLRDQIRELHFVNECWACQDKGQVGLKFQVSEGAESYDQLLSSVYLRLRETIESSDLLRTAGASWRATYETGALADEGVFAAVPDSTGRGGA